MICCVAHRGREEKGEEVKIVAVDLQAMAPLPGVTQIQGDITKVRTFTVTRFKVIVLCRIITSNSCMFFCSLPTSVL